MYIAYFNKKKPQVPKVLRVSFDTTWIMVQYWYYPQQVTVYTGTGVVWENLTCSIPVFNPRSRGAQHHHWAQPPSTTAAGAVGTTATQWQGTTTTAARGAGRHQCHANTHPLWQSLSCTCRFIYYLFIIYVIPLVFVNSWNNNIFLIM